MQLQQHCRPDQVLSSQLGLMDLINYLPGKITMVEVGSYAGESALIFLNNPRVERFYSVDPWMSGYDDSDPASTLLEQLPIEEEYDYRLSPHLASGRAVKYKMTSLEGATLFKEGSLDFVYIDGLHTYEGVKNDINAWLPKIKKGSHIAGHDYSNPDFPGVTKAVLEKLGDPDHIFQDTSWVKKIN